MRKSIKLALIGVGRWGSNYVKTIDSINDVEIVSLTSKKENIKNFLTKDCIVEKDWKKLILAKNIDGVIISSPPHTHYQIIMDCLELNIPLLVEKPFVLKVEEAEKILNLAKRKSTLVLVNYIHLYHPAFLKLIDNLDQYENLKSIESFSGNYGPFREDVRALWDWAPHDIAMCLEIMNQTPKVSRAYFLKKDNDYLIPAELLVIELLFPNKIKANITIGNLLEKKSKRLTINFENVSLIYDPICKDPLIKKTHNEKSISIGTKQEKPLTKLVRKFANLIIEKSHDLHDLELSLKVTKLITESEKLLELSEE